MPPTGMNLQGAPIFKIPIEEGGALRVGAKELLWVRKKTEKMRGTQEKLSEANSRAFPCGENRFPASISCHISNQSLYITEVYSER